MDREANFFRKRKLDPKSFTDGNLVNITTAAKSLQSCLTLYDPTDGSPPGSPVPGILQARTLEWVAISFPSAWKWKVKGKSLSRVWLFPTPWTAAYQAPPSMGFSRQEYWSGVPLPSPQYNHGTTQFTNPTHPASPLQEPIGVFCMIRLWCPICINWSKEKGIFFFFLEREFSLLIWYFFNFILYSNYYI